jgi:hypothetical protein
MLYISARGIAASLSLKQGASDAPAVCHPVVCLAARWNVLAGRVAADLKQFGDTWRWLGDGKRSIIVPRQTGVEI